MSRLIDMLEALESITRFTHNRTIRDLLADDFFQSAVSRQLITVGEAAARLTADLRARHPTVPWGKIIAFRNVLVHHYFGIDWVVVWKTVTEQVPQVQQQIEMVVRAEFPDLQR